MITVLSLHQSLTPIQGRSYISVDGTGWVDCPPQMLIDEVSLGRVSAHLLTLRIVADPPAFFAIHTRMNCVTTLTLHRVVMEQVAGCLAFAPNVVRLTIVPGSPLSRANITFPTTPIIMHRLKYFSLTQSSYDQFYGSIIAPSLVSLELEPGVSDGLELQHFANLTHNISYLYFAGQVYNFYVFGSRFPSLCNITVLRLDVFLRSWPEGDINPRKLMSLMKLDPRILPNLWEIRTNKVWFKNTLDLFCELQQHDMQRPRLTLGIFYQCASPVEPIPRYGLVEDLIAAKIVYLFRQYL